MSRIAAHCRFWLRRVLLAGFIGLLTAGAWAGDTDCDGVADVPWQRVAQGVWV